MKEATMPKKQHHQQQQNFPKDNILDEPLKFQHMPLLMTEAKARWKQNHQIQQHKIQNETQQHKSTQKEKKHFTLASILSDQEVYTLKKNLELLKKIEGETAR